MRSHSAQIVDVWFKSIFCGDWLWMSVFIDFGYKRSYDSVMSPCTEASGDVTFDNVVPVHRFPAAPAGSRLIELFMKILRAES